MLRKTILLLSLAVSLVAALIAIALQEDLRERLGNTDWVLGLAIIGCVLLVLSGYVRDRTLLKQLKTRRATATVHIEDDPDDHSDPDEIVGLARKIERMAKALQNVEASYRAIAEGQNDFICRYRPDERLTFVIGAYSRAFGRKRVELAGSQFPFLESTLSRDAPLSFRVFQCSAIIRWEKRPRRLQFRAPRVRRRNKLNSATAAEICPCR